MSVCRESGRSNSGTTSSSVPGRRAGTDPRATGRRRDRPGSRPRPAPRGQCSPEDLGCEDRASLLRRQPHHVPARLRAGPGPVCTALGGRTLLAGRERSPTLRAAAHGPREIAARLVPEDDAVAIPPSQPGTAATMTIQTGASLVTTRFSPRCEAQTRSDRGRPDGAFGLVSVRYPECASTGSRTFPRPLPPRARPPASASASPSAPSAWPSPPAPSPAAPAGLQARSP